MHSCQTVLFVASEGILHLKVGSSRQHDDSVTLPKSYIYFIVRVEYNSWAPTAQVTKKGGDQEELLLVSVWEDLPSENEAALPPPP